ncbi:MAG: ComF family protein [Candidatus Cryptobacteroides sp.]
MKLQSFARDASRALLDLAMPRRCIVCHTPLALRENHICLHCLADLPRTYFSICSRNQMADRFNDLIRRSAGGDEPFSEYSYATSLFFYRSDTGYSLITQRLKYHSDLSAGRYFAAMLGREMKESPVWSDVDALIPVPLHWTRRWSRGYNQAEVIAQELSRCLGVPVRTDLLVRPRRTRTQTKISVSSKATNVRGAFRVRTGADIAGLSHVVIVDDVFTTGATVHSCYLALREVFPSSVRISVATLGCVGQ